MKKTSPRNCEQAVYSHRQIASHVFVAARHNPGRRLTAEEIAELRGNPTKQLSNKPCKK